MKVIKNIPLNFLVLSYREIWRFIKKKKNLNLETRKPEKNYLIKKKGKTKAKTG